LQVSFPPHLPSPSPLSLATVAAAPSIGCLRCRPQYRLPPLPPHSTGRLRRRLASPRCCRTPPTSPLSAQYHRLAILRVTLVATISNGGDAQCFRPRYGSPWRMSILTHNLMATSWRSSLESMATPGHHILTHNSAGFSRYARSASRGRFRPIDISRQVSTMVSSYPRNSLQIMVIFLFSRSITIAYYFLWKKDAMCSLFSCWIFFFSSLDVHA
jgi:hypothetical protein